MVELDAPPTLVANVLLALKVDEPTAEFRLFELLGFKGMWFIVLPNWAMKESKSPTLPIPEGTWEPFVNLCVLFKFLL